MTEHSRMWCCRRPGKRVVAEAVPHYSAVQEKEVMALVGRDVGEKAMLHTRRCVEQPDWGCVFALALQSDMCV
eukprot:788516-Rhodomonas_salina.5